MSNEYRVTQRYGFSSTSMRCLMGTAAIVRPPDVMPARSAVTYDDLVLKAAHRTQDQSRIHQAAPEPVTYYWAEDEVDTRKTIVAERAEPMSWDWLETVFYFAYCIGVVYAIETWELFKWP